MASRDRTSSPTPGRWVVAVLCAAALAACTSSHPSAAGATSAIGSSVASSSSAAGSVLNSPAASVASASTAVASSPASVPPPLVVAAPTPSPTPTPAATATPTAKPSPTPTKPAVPTATRTSPAAPPQLLVQQLKDVGNAQQVVIVTSASWSTDVATLQMFEKDAGVWRAVFPAMAANIGRDGFSADKHEGDLRTPAGKYGFGTMFGQRANPGVKLAYRVADANSVWVDDTTSSDYNTWQEDVPLSEGEALASSEFKVAYAYAVDIAYNTNPVQKGLGSAIFLHVGNGRGSSADGTAGCVSIAQTNLLKVLRWLDPARAPIIVMGPTSVIRQY